MNKIIARIKTELFYIKRLIEEGYGPSYWWPYVKNRFFGNYLFTHLPRYDYVADTDLELHTICSRHGQGLWMFAWMLSSFLFHSKLRPVVVIHDDGTIDKATEKLIQSKFPNTKVMFRDETTKRILEMPGIISQLLIMGKEPIIQMLLFISMGVLYLLLKGLRVLFPN